MAEAVRKRRLDIKELTGTDDKSTKEAKKNVDSLWSYLYGKKSSGKDYKTLDTGDIVNSENINSYIPEVADDRMSELVKQLAAQDIAVKNGKATWADFYENLSDGEKRYIPNLVNEMNDVSKVTGNDIVKANQKARKSTIDYNNGLKQMTLGAKAAKFAMSALASVGTMVVMTLITQGISKLMNAEAEALSKAQESYEKAVEEVDKFQEREELVTASTKELSELLSSQTWGAEQAKAAGDIYDKLADRLEDTNSASEERIKELRAEADQMRENIHLSESQRAAKLKETQEKFLADSRWGDQSRVTKFENQANAAGQVFSNTILDNFSNVFNNSGISGNVHALSGDVLKAKYDLNTGKYSAVVSNPTGVSSKIYEKMKRFTAIGRGREQEYIKLSGVDGTTSEYDAAIQFIEEMEDLSKINGVSEDPLYKAYLEIYNKLLPAYQALKNDEKAKKIVTAEEFADQWFKTFGVGFNDVEKEDRFIQYLQDQGVQQDIIDAVLEELKAAGFYSGEYSKSAKTREYSKHRNRALEMLNGDWEKAQKFVNELSFEDLDIVDKMGFDADTLSIEQFTYWLQRFKDHAKQASEESDSLSESLKTLDERLSLVNEVEKDLNANGMISSENIQKILTAYPELEGELYEYIMGVRSGASVMDLLKSKTNDMAVISESAFKKMYLSSSLVSDDMKKDFEIAFTKMGLSYSKTQSVMANINSQIIDANGAVCTTFSTQWATACASAGVSVLGFAQGMSAMMMGDFFTPEKGYGVYKDVTDEKGNVIAQGYYNKTKTGETINMTNVQAWELLAKGENPITAENYNASNPEHVQAYRDAYSAAYLSYGTLYDSGVRLNAENKRLEELQERLKKFAVDSDNKSGSEKNEALDNYLKDAENLYKIHQDETQYINDLQWAQNNLVKSKEEELEVIGKINKAYRDLADNRIKDIQHEIDLDKERYGDDYDDTAQQEEIKRIAHEEADRYREYARKELGYYDEGVTDEQRAKIDATIEKTDEIQGLQKTWWDAENTILDNAKTRHENAIRDIEHEKDMVLAKDEDADVTSYYKRLQDEYHKEAERLRALDPEKYKEDIQELMELWWDAENEMLDRNKQVVQDFFNELQDKLNETYDIRISRLNSQSTLLSKHFELVNSIAEEQHSLNKEMREAETIGAKMNEQERQSLMTRSEYNNLSGKLNGIMLDLTSMQNAYIDDLENATKDTIDEVTKQYERQYELKMKEYEIVKAELNLIKAQQKLENVENEKSVRTWNGSGWVYEANIQDVLDAQEEVDDARYEYAKSKTEEAQQKALNAIGADADALQTEKNELTSAIEDMAEKMKGSGKNITSMLQYIAENDLPMFDAIIQAMGGSIKNAFNISDEDMTNIRNTNPTAYGIEQMKSNSLAWHSADESTKKALVEANKRWADMLGLDFDEATGRWKKPDGTYAYARGTKNANKGLGLFDEGGFGSELILTDNGILTQFNGGERVFTSDMADRLWEFSKNNSLFNLIQPNIFKSIPIEDRINNAINNISNAFGDTYMIKDVQLNESEGGTLKGFIDFLKKKV